MSPERDAPERARPDGGEDEELPAWSLRRDDPRARGLPRAWPHRLDREWAWGGADGAGIRVAIVDSGVDGSHELVGRLQRAVAVEKSAEGEPVLVEDQLGDVAGHGTACAGIVRSIAPACELWSVRVLGPGSRGGAGALLAGLRWAVEQGSAIVNLCLSTPNRETAALLHEIADEAYFRGTVFVASAHNLDVRSYPWRFASVISVASHDGQDPFEILDNPEPPVEFLARGVGIEVAWLDGSRIVAAGNSFATAYLTGICALVLAKHPGLTPFQLKTVLWETAANACAPGQLGPRDARGAAASRGRGWRAGRPRRSSAAAAVDGRGRACDLRRPGCVDHAARRGYGRAGVRSGRRRGRGHADRQPHTARYRNRRLGCAVRQPLVVEDVARRRASVRRGSGAVRPARRCMLGQRSAAFVLSRIFVLSRKP